MRLHWKGLPHHDLRDFKADVLVVCEKDSVAKAVASALSDGYKALYLRGVPCYFFDRGGRSWIVVGLRGHLMNFDFDERFNDWNHVDPKDLFKIRPVRVVRSESARYVEVLRDLGRNVEEVILALDADVEGEAIAFEVIDVIKTINPYADFKRAWFSSLDKEELLQAFDNLRAPNRKFAEKSFARSIIDLVVGASFTRLLTLKVREVKSSALPKGHFISYGPCQSPTLYFVVKRALERDGFQSQKFYRIVARLKIGEETLEVEHSRGRFSSKEEAENVRESIKSALWAKVEDVKVTKTKRGPPKPLDTVELESLASKYLNMRAKRALDVAEELYRRGFISYPRTETQIYPPSAYDKLKAFAAHPELGDYVKRLLAQGAKPTSGVKDDKAHPPIHPIKAATRSEVEREVGRDGWKLYELIARHFIATFSPPAQFEGRKYTINISGEKFVYATLEVVDKGFLAIYGYDYPREVPHLPVKVNDEVQVLGIEVKEGQTEPPPYLSESELLKLMEKWGIGTDATMQDHIQTNVDRGYMYIEARRCIPTELGKRLIVQLEKFVPELVRPEVRSMMEKQLIKVAQGEEDIESVITRAKDYFFAQYLKLEEKIHEVAKSITEVSLRSIMEAEQHSKRRRKTKKTKSSKKGGEMSGA